MCKDGSRVPLEVWLSVVDTAGGKETLASLVDISSQKIAQAETATLQQQLFQAHKMDSIGRLAGGVAHAFNNILTIIMAHSELLLSKLADDDSITYNINQIRDAAIRSAELTQRLLGFARGQTELPEVINLNQKVDDLLLMLGSLIGEHVTLTWLPDSNIDAVYMDNSQLVQILVNLCVNGRDASGNFGNITIKTFNRQLDQDFCLDYGSASPGDYVCLMVSDNGEGMTSAVIEQIFEPFFTTKPKGGGTGLGLATVYGIVKQNNGIITVESELGLGTIFSVYFPSYLGKSEIKQEDTSITGYELRSNASILLVDDDENIVDIANKMLTLKGYSVVATTKPSEAIDLVIETPSKFNLVISDVVMPAMSGPQLINKLLKANPDLKFILMSGFIDDVLKNLNVESSSINFLHKPFGLEQLDLKVQQVFP